MLKFLLLKLTCQLGFTKDSCLVTASAAHNFTTLSVLFGSLLLTVSAQAASCQLPKSFYKNVSCTADSTLFLAVKDFGAPVALIDKKGKKVVDLLKYQRVDANKIAGGLMPVQRNSRVGYVNLRGREVVPTRYDIINEGNSWARAVSNDRIIVKSNGDFGIINSSNQVILPFSSTIDTIDNYRNGSARLVKANVISTIDKQGNIRLSATDDNKSASKEKKPTSATEKQARSTPAPSDASVPKRRVPQPKVTQRKAFTTLQAQQQDGKWGFVDDQNTIMITYSFDDVRPFSEGLAGVKLDNKWGFVTLGGELVIPFEFEDRYIPIGEKYQEVSAFVFKNGKAWIGHLEDGSKMCISKAGAAVACDL